MARACSSPKYSSSGSCTTMVKAGAMAATAAAMSSTGGSRPTRVRRKRAATWRIALDSTNRVRRRAPVAPQVGGDDMHVRGQEAGEAVDHRRAAGVEEAVDEDDHRRRIRRPVETGGRDAHTVGGGERQQLLPPPTRGERVLAGPVR